MGEPVQGDRRGRQQSQGAGREHRQGSASPRRRRRGAEERPPAAGDCARCELRAELAHLIAVNARLRTDMAELLDFFEDISRLLAAAGGAGREPFE